MSGIAYKFNAREIIANVIGRHLLSAARSNYLPLSFKSPKEQEYIEFLWDAFETNNTHGNCQFAFLAYHRRHPD